MQLNILMIGRNKSIIESLEKDKKSINIFLIEEKDIYNVNPPETYRSSLIKEILFSEFHQSLKSLDVVKKISKDNKISAVIPGIEYAVKAANEVAKLLNLPRLGDNAVKVLTNKIKFREFLKSKKLPFPNFKKVNSIDELKNFFNGTPIIFKPANRQASVGVQKIDSIESIEECFNHTINAKELKSVKRPIKWEYIAEDYLEGFEYSIETLIWNKKPVFSNVTKKLTLSDTVFVETAHIVPAPLDKITLSQILAENNAFITALQADSGVLHSEWKMTKTGPVLIECAGRVPGDMIPNLISESYEFNFNRAYVDILLNKEPWLNTLPKYTSIISFFTPKAGMLDKIKNFQILEDKMVIRKEITVKEGDNIPEIQDSWSRIGYFILKSENPSIAFEKVDHINKMLEFDVTNLTKIAT